MYRNKTIGLVIPAHNEERLIGPTLDAVPTLVDKVFVVDDLSTDGQNAVVKARAAKDPRVELLEHTVNLGPGGAIITGYRRAAKLGCDVVVVVGGDNQMPLDEITNFLDPVIDGKADYAKGNRFLLGQLDLTLARMPRLRLVGNWLIAFVAKFASGNFKTMDFVDGYTAISKRAIDVIDWDVAWREYGYPMDFIIRLNAYSFRVLDVARTAIYLPGERQSQIKGFKYFLRVTPMLVRGFFWRIAFKYLYRDFHPIFLFYTVGLATMAAGTLLGLVMTFNKLFAAGDFITGSKAILVALCLLMGFQFFISAVQMDMNNNE
jgi:glycosyltransferase involved in cell wall biosynthesis